MYRAILFEKWNNRKNTLPRNLQKHQQERNWFVFYTSKKMYNWWPRYVIIWNSRIFISIWLSKKALCLIAEGCTPGVHITNWLSIYYMVLFPDTPTYNRLIAKDLRNNNETCRWWPSIPKDHNSAPENSQRQGWTKIDKIDVNWKIGVLIRKFSIF